MPLFALFLLIGLAFLVGCKVGLWFAILGVKGTINEGLLIRGPKSNPNPTV